jgi:hypothetical protein
LLGLQDKCRPFLQDFHHDVGNAVVTNGFSDEFPEEGKIFIFLFHLRK